MSKRVDKILATIDAVLDEPWATGSQTSFEMDIARVDGCVRCGAEAEDSGWCATCNPHRPADDDDLARRIAETEEYQAREPTDPEAVPARPERPQWGSRYIGMDTPSGVRLPDGLTFRLDVTPTFTPSPIERVMRQGCGCEMCVTARFRQAARELEANRRPEVRQVDPDTSPLWRRLAPDGPTVREALAAIDGVPGLTAEIDAVIRQAREVSPLPADQLDRILGTLPDFTAELTPEGIRVLSDPEEPVQMTRAEAEARAGHELPRLGIVPYAEEPER